MPKVTLETLDFNNLELTGKLIVCYNGVLAERLGVSPSRLYIIKILFTTDSLIEVIFKYFPTRTH